MPDPNEKQTGKKQLQNLMQALAYCISSDTSLKAHHLIGKVIAWS